jgi:tetratricopeptide (TPR) repeat protein
MKLRVEACAGLVALAATGACATAPVVRQTCYNPDAQLAAVLEPLEAARARGCGQTDCVSLEREIGRLALVCPGHVPTLMANAVIAYDRGRPEVAQPFLDELLARGRSQPAAAVLRARIAMEQGNLSYARRLLAEQITLAPDRPELHETLGAALYLDRNLPEASRELATAAALGAPRWRIEYHQGLIAEASGDEDAARRHYRQALAENPGWTPAEARLKGLSVR